MIQHGMKTARHVQRRWNQDPLLLPLEQDLTPAILATKGRRPNQVRA